MLSEVLRAVLCCGVYGIYTKERERARARLCEDGIG